MGAMASQITRLTIAYWSVYSSADQRKHQSSASLAFVRGIHRWPVNSPYKRPVTRKMLPFDDVIMVLAVNLNNLFNEQSNCQRLDTPLRSYDLTVINNIEKIYHEYQVISKLYGYSSHFLSVLRLDIDSIMMLVKFSYLSQSDRSNWVMWQVKDPCPRPEWDGCLTREKMAFIKSIKTWIILLYIWFHL